jgi:hypothetical protein
MLIALGVNGCTMEPDNIDRRELQPGYLQCDTLLPKDQIAQNSALKVGMAGLGLPSGDASVRSS